MDNIENEKLLSLITDAIKERLEEQRIVGMIIGWNACLAEINSEIGEISTVEEIKALIANKIAESKERVEKQIPYDEGCEDYEEA